MEVQIIKKEGYADTGMRALLEIPKPPEQLWVSGLLPPPEIKKLAVVGSRALSRYGRESCEYLLEGLRGYPISIISGLALGADACAHRAALAAGLHTIAIPGSGLDDHVIGPRSNYGLAMSILAAGGALLSEQEPGHAARPEDFPSRNRIMVGLSDAVLIIEAGEHSGTLITARMAADYNRDLLCVPHRIGDTHSYGSHLFLRLGAAHISEPSHLLEALNIPIRTSVAESELLPTLSESERVIYGLLIEPLPRDELIRRSYLPTSVALSALLALELQGLVTEAFGAWQRII